MKRVPLQKRVAVYSDRHDMLSPDDGVLVGVSGGVDSMVLLDILHHLSSERPFRLRAAHLNHGLRGSNAARDMALVKAYCRMRKIPFSSETIDLRACARREKQSLEECGRIARYAFLSSEATRHGIGTVAVAHTADDQVETFLMRLLRGAGGRGLGGMRPVRREGKLSIIRPLLEVWKQECRSYARRHDIPFREDESNRDLSFRRNWVRQRLIPYLCRASEGDVKTVLIRTARIIRDEHDVVVARAEEAFSSIATHADEHVALPVAQLGEQPEAVRAQVFRKAHARLAGAGELSFHDICALEKLAGGRGGYAVHPCPGGVSVSREHGKAVFRRMEDAGDGAYEKPLEDGMELPCGSDRLRFRIAVLSRSRVKKIRSSHAALSRVWKMEPETWPLHACFSFDRVTGKRLVIRNRRQGDRYRPTGLKGTKKVKDIMIDEKLPVPFRDRVPLLTCDGDIIWLAGYRVAAEYAVTAATRRVMQVTVETVS